MDISFDISMDISVDISMDISIDISMDISMDVSMDISMDIHGYPWICPWMERGWNADGTRMARKPSNLQHLWSQISSHDYHPNSPP